MIDELEGRRSGLTEELFNGSPVGSEENHEKLLPAEIVPRTSQYKPRALPLDSTLRM
jgi:hypothetical protein